MGGVLEGYYCQSLGNTSAGGVQGVLGKHHSMGSVLVSHFFSPRWTPQQMVSYAENIQWVVSKGNCHEKIGLL